MLKKEYKNGHRIKNFFIALPTHSSEGFDSDVARFTV